MWAGRGWAFDEDGLRQLPSTGGSNAMQGVQVFESVGAAAEEVKVTDQKIVKEVPVAAAAAEHAALRGEGQKPNSFQRNNVAKQSGVQKGMEERPASLVRSVLRKRFERPKDQRHRSAVSREETSGPRPLGGRG